LVFLISREYPNGSGCTSTAMSESLKDQLRALGLAPKPSNVPAKKPGRTRKANSRKAHVARRSDKVDISLDQAYRIRHKQEKLQKEQAIAQKREQERQRREINQKIKALIREFAVRDESADAKRNFLYKGRIRSVLTTPAQLREINEGQLGIVYLSGNYHLLPSAKVDEVRAFSPEHVPDLTGAESEDDGEHPVPDDLIW